MIGRVVKVLLDPALGPDGEDLSVDPELLRPVGQRGQRHRVARQPREDPVEHLDGRVVITGLHALDGVE